jgi:hypothetical protein
MSLLFDPDKLPAILVVALLIVCVTIVVLLRKQRSPAVSKLNIYPIKAFANIRVKEAIATELGFENDRIAQVSDKDGASTAALPPRGQKFAKLFRDAKQMLKNKKLALSASEADSSFEVDLVNGKT